MPNKIDRRLAPIFCNIERTRTFLPPMPVGHDQLCFDWIKRALDEIEKTLREIDTERVLVVQRAGRRTEDIFENKVGDAVKQIEDSSGILYSVDQIFKNQTQHSADILEKTRQIGAHARTMRRQLKCVTSSWCRFIRSWKPILFLFVVAFLAIAVVGIYRAERGKPPVQALTERFQKDTKALRSAATNATGLERVVMVTEQVKEIGQLIPAILVVVASTLTALKGISSAFQALKQNK